MCGIAGIVKLKGGNCNSNSIDLLRSSLSHRGPDGSGLYQSACKMTSMIHTRLSILDLSDSGLQPMTLGNSGLWITFNGEIYNFLELRKELEELGYRFITDTDTEVLLAAYIEWGESCQLRFNGMWAFAIWDDKNKTLFLSRDRFGVKPLYYAFREGTFFFASEQKSILLCSNQKPNINDSMAAVALTGSSLVEAFEDCLFDGCKRLLPGFSLRLRQNGDVNKKRWWKTYEHLTPQLASQPKAQREKAFRDRFLSACELRLRSDTDIAFALSGGIDSSSVLCGVHHLVNHHSNPLKRQPDNWNTAFTASYIGTDQDELSWAQIPAEETATPLNVIDVHQSLSVDSILSCILAVGDVVEPAIGPWLMYEEMKRLGYKVSLEGHGPDEYMAGYSYYWQPYLADLLLADGEMNHFVKAVSGLVHSLPSDSQVSRSNFRRLIRGAKLDCDSPLGVIPEQVISKLHSLPFLFEQEELDYLKQCSHLQRRLYLDFHFSSLPAILRNFDRCSMAHSIEVRSPFLDWELVCLGFSAPDEDKICQGITKKLIRDSLTFLPEPIRCRHSKIGFCSPMEGWLENELKMLVLDTLNSASFLSASWCDGKAFKKLADECYQLGDMVKLRTLWPVINIQLLASMRG